MYVKLCNLTVEFERKVLDVTIRFTLGSQP